MNNKQYNVPVQMTQRGFVKVIARNKRIAMLEAKKLLNQYGTGVMSEMDEDIEFEVIDSFIRQIT